MINIEEIFIVNIAGVLILTFSLLSRIENSREKNFSDNIFDIMIAVTIGALIAEVLTFEIDGRPGVLVRNLQYLLNAYLFIASCGVGTLWVMYVDYRIYHSLKRIQQLLIPVVAPFVIIVVLVVCDLFDTGLLFDITEQNVYQRGKLMIISNIILFYDYFLSFVTSIVAVKQNNHAEFFPSIQFIITCVAGTVIQLLNYGLAVGWFSVSVAFMFLQMLLNKQNAFVDNLSGLYNRKYYNCVISKLVGSRKNETISGVMMDVNQFKSINDRFGHTIGDEAIRDIGKLISEVTTERDMAFRHAGDEFVILSAIDSEQDVKRLIDNLQQRIDEFNETSDRPYELSLSMGYAVCKTDNLNFDEFLRQMDKNMYEAKASYYSKDGGNNDRYLRAIADIQLNAQT